jgi:hypothetical protein
VYDVPVRGELIVRALGVAAVIVMSAEPLKLVPLIVLEVARVVAVDAFPVRAPTKVVDVIDVIPAIVPVVEPKLMEVEPSVNEPVPVLTVFQAVPS